MEKILKATEKIHDILMSLVRIITLIKIEHSFIRALNILTILVFKDNFIRNKLDSVEELLPGLE